jgi:predicted DNA-binding transcriptional regulator AlpA
MHYPPDPLDSSSAAAVKDAEPSRSKKAYAAEKYILREAEAALATGLSASSIRNRIDRNGPYYDPEFPLPVALSQGTGRTAVGWIKSEIVYWVNTRPRVFNLHQLTKLKKKPKSPQKPAPSPKEWKV